MPPESEPERFQKADVKTEVPVAVGEGLVPSIVGAKPPAVEQRRVEIDFEDLKTDAEDVVMLVAAR